MSVRDRGEIPWDSIPILTVLTSPLSRSDHHSLQVRHGCSASSGPHPTIVTSGRSRRSISAPPKMIGNIPPNLTFAAVGPGCTSNLFEIEVQLGIRGVASPHFFTVALKNRLTIFHLATCLCMGYSSFLCLYGPDAFCKLLVRDVETVCMHVSGLPDGQLPKHARSLDEIRAPRP